MKKEFSIISSFILIGIGWFVNACNSDSSSDWDSIPTDSITIAKGHTSFLNNCGGCHNFKHNGIGPQLAGISSENSVEWVKNFIIDPKKIIESGDERAQKLFKRFKTI